jgi:hypothetical protein
MCVVQSGQLSCRGDNEFGALGLGHFKRADDFEPVVWPESLGLVTHVVASRRHTCARTVSGRIACFGDGRSRAFGLDLRAKDDSFEEIATTAGLRRYTDVAAGRSHACAITQEGLVSCWGSNDQGQLGFGVLGAATPQLVPELVEAVSIAAAGDRTCVLRRKHHQLTCWGNGSPSKRQQASLAVTAIALGRDRACALRANGRISCWSQAEQALVPASSPSELPGVTGAEAIIASDDVLCYAHARGLYCALGDGPFRAVDGAVASAMPRGPAMSACLGPTYGCAPDERGGAVCFDFAAARRTTGPIATRAHTFEPHERAVVSVVCGERAYAMMQMGQAHQIFGPPDPDEPPISIDMAHGGDFECRLDGSHTIHCRGDQRFGQLGRGVQAFASTPVEVPFQSVGARAP